MIVRSDPTHDPPREPAVRRRSRLRRRVAMVALLAITSVAISDVSSPFEDADALQRRFRETASTAARSVYAVTAFAAAPADARLWSGGVDANAFAAIAGRERRSCGSAFAIDADGHLVTNEHVVGGAVSVWVTDDAGRVWPAVVVGTDPRSDLAVLSIPTRTQALPLAASPPHRGDLVLTLGNPDGLATTGELSASVGCVSATNRSLPALSARERRDYSGLIQMTTPIAVGSSGGPLVDLSGRAMGVVSAVATSDAHGGVVGFAIALSPTNLARVVALVRGAEVGHPYFGVRVGPVDPAADGTRPAGARVDHVEADAPADAALREGDVVTHLAGRAVASDRAFVEFAGACALGRPVRMTVRRDDAVVDVVVSPRPRPMPAAAVVRATQRLAWAGVTFDNATGGVRVAALGVDATLPLAAGTVVRRINGEPVADVAALLRVLHAATGGPLTLDADP